MMKSLFSGVSGLKTHQTRMDVIGNNIANVNTTAFKSKNVNFSDMLYQTTQPSAPPNAEAGTGGVNARQIGLGVKTAAINTTITQEGANQSTGNPFDLKLTGEAFFVVSDGTNTYYTRDGAFNVDDMGNLCMASTGYIVKGWGVDPATGKIRQGSIENLNVMSKSSYDPAGTTSAKVSGILDKTDADLETKNGRIMNVQILDKLGYEYNLQFGILPKQIVQKSTVDILNTENEYALPTNFFKVDTSKLEYSYNDGNEDKIIPAADLPQLIEALDDAAWTWVNQDCKGTIPVSTTSVGAGNLTVVGRHDLGKKDNAVQIRIDNEFLTKYKLDMLRGSNLMGKYITVSFSGEVGYVETKDATPPTYPLKNLNVSKINEDAVKLFYDIQPAVNGVAKCNPRPSRSTITTIKQDYEDANGTAVTKYTFKGTATPPEINNDDDTPIDSKLYSDIMTLMKLGKENPIKDVYYTRQEAQTKTPDPGKYEVTLLGMSSYGKEVDISKLGNNTKWNLEYNADNGKFTSVGGAKSFTLGLAAIDNKFANVAIDWSDTSSVFNEGKSTLTGLKADGYTVGKLKGVSIAQDGMITANYTNGMSATIGQICVGTFANAMGLQNSGDNLYSETPNSGDCRVVDIKASGTGYMTTGVLEMSNVDLSQEFTTMITTQRGFQANSRIITTSDGMIEELVNLKR